MHVQTTFGVELLRADPIPPPASMEWADRPLRLPLIGFVWALALSVPLWGLMVWAAWAWLP